MLTLYQTLERLALQTSRFDGGIDKAAQAIALIFKAEILHHPWGSSKLGERVDPNVALQKRNLIWNRLAKPRDMQHLIVLVIRDLQDHALTILRERGERLGLILDDALDERQQALVLEHWDALTEPPTYTALAKAVEKV